MRMSFALALVLLATFLSASAAEPFKGKIVKLDAAIGKVTLTHGAIPKLDMPGGMTMGYRVADPAMLKGLAVSDRVTFDARDDGGSYTITGIEKSK